MRAHDHFSKKAAETKKDKICLLEIRKNPRLIPVLPVDQSKARLYLAHAQYT